ncbi:MAG: Tat pathway signal protein [Thermoprotei archaeon]|nr:MAG: Tat pathway signal protein [Thermoprotei archaeon]RLF00844.1 MAG: Tat pathway signal protein [Thermoprotei archaeon]HDI75073.1 Tat pathway signal protein [Thermoprotei archaeon]
MIVSWFNTRTAFERGVEKVIKELNDLRVEKVFPIIVDGSGSLYDSILYDKGRSIIGDEKLKELFDKLHKAGIEVHPWIVSLNRPHPDFVSRHRDWYVVNRNGVSCVDKPPYVDHYKWLCPSRETTRRFLAETALEIVSKFDVEGVHLDYIRLPDVILPIHFRKRYKLPLEAKILPEYDYCYCSVCRQKYKEETGIDPIEIKYSDKINYERWFKWRARQVSSVVEEVYKSLKKYDSELKLSAAVFPTPLIAYRYVFQQWASWKIDFLCPMIYHKYYEKPVDWILEASLECVATGREIYAGIHAYMLEEKEDAMKAVKLALESGADGVCFFLYPFPYEKQVEYFKEAVRKYTAT